MCLELIRFYLLPVSESRSSISLPDESNEDFYQNRGLDKRRDSSPDSARNSFGKGLSSLIGKSSKSKETPALLPPTR